MSMSLLDAVQWRQDDGLLVFRDRAGAVRGFPAPEFSWGEGPFKQIDFYIWRRRVEMVVDGLGLLQFELASHKSVSPLRGRSMVYLDQNHMSSLSKAIHAPDRLRSARERDHAMELMRLVATGKIVVPLSAAHLAETSAWRNRQGRHELGFTVLAVSRGWQLRDPLEVRLHEYASSLAASAGLPYSAPPPVTLEPFAALDPSARGEPGVDVGVGDPLAAYASRAVLGTQVYAAIMFERESIPRGDLSGWLGGVSTFQEWLDGERERSKIAKRRSAQVFMLADAKLEVARACVLAGVTVDQLHEWNKATWDSHDLGSPGISYFRGAMVEKMLSGHRWEPNDLTDLIYLSAAAASTDHVVGDRRTIAMLGQVRRRLGYGARLHRDLGSLLDELAS